MGQFTLVNRISDQQLAVLVGEWGVRTRGRGRRWSGRDLVGAAIRWEVEKAGHWKNAPRGNPRKGYRVMRAGRGINSAG